MDDEPQARPDPGERRLERPPSDRYRDLEPPAPSASPPPDVPVRGLALALVVAIVGALATVAAVGVFEITAGLLVIASLLGWSTGVVLRAGGAAGWPRSRRTIVAVVVALVGVALGQLGLWLLGRQEGGVLPLVEYLGEVFGVLVPLQFLIAAIGAWLGSR